MFEKLLQGVAQHHGTRGVTVRLLVSFDVYNAILTSRESDRRFPMGAGFTDLRFCFQSFEAPVIPVSWVESYAIEITRRPSVQEWVENHVTPYRSGA